MEVFRVVFSFLLLAEGVFGGEWLSWGKHINNDRWASDETIINPENVNQLRVKYLIQTPAAVEVTPTVIGDDIYGVSFYGDVSNTDFNTGELKWQKWLFEYNGLFGDFSRTSPLILDDMIIIGSNVFAEMFAINRFNGDLIWRTTLTEVPCSKIVVSPVFAGKFIYIGVSSGSLGANDCPFGRGMMFALHPEDGSVVWNFETIQQNETDPFKASAGASIWGRNPSFDIERNMVFVPTGQPYTLPQSAYDCQKRRSPSDPSCIPDGVFSNAVIALDMTTGEYIWDTRLFNYDAYFQGCPVTVSAEIPPGCPDPPGSDYDVSQGPIVFEANINGTKIDAVGAGTKAGEYWAMNRETGEVLWMTKVGYGGALGGLQFGSAADEERIYVAECNSNRIEYRLETKPEQVIRSSHWAALDKSTGEILWETPVPNADPYNVLQDGRAHGPVTVANGVVYAGVMDPKGTMVAMDAETGEILWTFECGNVVGSGPAIVDGNVLWGCGYPGQVNPTGAFVVFHIPGLSR